MEYTHSIYIAGQNTEIQHDRVDETPSGLLLVRPLAITKVTHERVQSSTGIIIPVNNAAPMELDKDINSTDLPGAVPDLVKVSHALLSPAASEEPSKDLRTGFYL